MTESVTVEIPYSIAAPDIISTNGRAFELRDDIFQWLEENVGYDWDWSIDLDSTVDGPGEAVVVFYFTGSRKHEQATLFKLTFG